MKSPYISTRGYIKGNVKQVKFHESDQQIDEVPAEQLLYLRVNAKKLDNVPRHKVIISCNVCLVEGERHCYQQLDYWQATTGTKLEIKRSKRLLWTCHTCRKCSVSICPIWQKVETYFYIYSNYRSRMKWLTYYFVLSGTNLWLNKLRNNFSKSNVFHWFA